DEMVHVAKEMKRLGFEIPLLIGGATTSAKHTAVKIAPHYDHPVIHVHDASRSVGVVERLVSDEQRVLLAQENRKLQADLKASYEKRHTVNLVPYSEAVAKRFTTDWATIDIPEPQFLGTHSLATDATVPVPTELLPLVTLREYIDWSPFFHTWELKGKYPKILNDPTYGEQAKNLFRDANELLDRVIHEGQLVARGVYGF